MRFDESGGLWPDAASSTRPAPRTTPIVRRSDSRPSPATLAQVARAAGVSPATVWRVLNEPWLVKAKTIEAVRQVVAETGYTPNLIAGSLASNRTRMVALVVPTVANSIFAGTVEAITDRLSLAGYQTILGLSGYAPLQEEAVLEALISRRPDGIIVIGASHSPGSVARLRGAGIPIVEAWDLVAQPLDMLVGFSHAAVGRAIARHLAAKGYRRFGVVSADDRRALVRRDALADELAILGLEPPVSSLAPAPAKLHLGREGLARLLDQGARCDVVVCSSDTVAQGVIAEAQARGLAVPGDLAVMGFGDLDFAAHAFPTISTVRIDGAALGLAAAEAVLTRLAGNAPDKPINDVGFTLIDRQSA